MFRKRHLSPLFLNPCLFYKLLVASTAFTWAYVLVLGHPYQDIEFLQTSEYVVLAVRSSTAVAGVLVLIRILAYEMAELDTGKSGFCCGFSFVVGNAAVGLLILANLRYTAKLLIAVSSKVPAS